MSDDEFWALIAYHKQTGFHTLSWNDKRVLHQMYLTTKQWKDGRLLILERDHFTCVECGHPASEVHHLTYRHWTEERRYELVSLCHSCHRSWHEDDWQKKKWGTWAA